MHALAALVGAADGSVIAALVAAADGSVVAALMGAAAAGGDGDVGAADARAAVVGAV